MARTVELRSDTFTKPTDEMRAAMAQADVGDDVWGTDPTVAALQEKCASLFGFEDALYVVSGTMSNQLALRLLVAPGQELLCHEDAHIVMYERGAAAVHGQISTRTWTSPAPEDDLDWIETMIRADGFHAVPTAAIEIENTHTARGGMVTPVDSLRAIRTMTTVNGVRVHCDGARIWNAHVASGLELSECGSLFDTMSVCLSKGLGAPIGSVLLGTRDQMDEAREMRARLGGGWRQAGILAAAGIYAIDNHIDRLADDHRHAQRLASAAGTPPGRTQTNIVLFEVPDALHFVDEAAAEGVLCSAVAPSTVRLVTHLGVTEEDVDYACEILQKLTD
ncbi:L-threonine aldolase [Antricoccus suffuscus]|uniref:L-threonine aldolase n=1 Tax=Antricoccus suffuscus TaxID=1629062 RepID=A0A2T0ZYL5_9ACTN|nr:GntG family PLP-dependent aldolase [Antricoccus suffuscus]PRZ41384.1 L-threonine aldolase [Antricoccus suffuscus]